jgi:hypothetical protein
LPDGANDLARQAVTAIAIAKSPAPRFYQALKRGRLLRYGWRKRKNANAVSACCVESIVVWAVDA